MVGKTISHYKVLEKIGQGGFGEVFRAHDTKLNRDVALKILPEQFASDSQRMGRFQREAEVLALSEWIVRLSFWIRCRLFRFPSPAPLKNILLTRSASDRERQ